MEAWYQLEYSRKEYLHDLCLQKASYDGRAGEHDHCELCWDRFSRSSEDRQEGYFAKERRIWICCQCFHDFHALFHWTLADAEQMDAPKEEI